MVPLRLVRLLAVLGLVLGWALPAEAHILTGATATANCQGYKLTVNAAELTVGTEYTIDYSFKVACGANTPVTISGTIKFIATAATASETATGSFGTSTSGNGGNCEVTGSATLTSSGSTVKININGEGTGPVALMCPPFVCTIPPSGTAIGGAAVSWNKFQTVGSSDVVWINAHIGTPNGVSTSSITTVEFTGVTFVLNGKTYNLPDGFLIFNPAASATPTTTFDATFGLHGRWVTTLNPSHFSDEIFFDGAALPVNANLSGGGKATLNYTTLSSDKALAFTWQWSAAVYKFWPGNNQAEILPYHHTLHAGTPLNLPVQQSLIQGPRGGGGSNFTGSWSGTGSGVCPE